MKTRYSAFISSNYKTLMEERLQIIDALLDQQIIPICMEHFTAAANEKEKALKKHIDQSDIFIMLLGDRYGTPDENGKSWTQREYEYAKEKNMPMYVLLSQSYIALKNKAENGETLTENEQKQYTFGNSIDFAQEINESRSIDRIISQIISTTDFSKCIGWTRKSLQNEKEWKDENKVYDISGKWYHVHLKSEDSSYIRVGSAEITQQFDEENYKHIKISASNYDISNYDANSGRISLNKLKKTAWKGDYELNDSGRIMGIYEAHREFKGPYDDWIADEGIYIGIHEFFLVDEDEDYDTTDSTVALEGTFKDVAPSRKTGRIYMFRDKEKRNKFIIETFYGENGGNEDE